MSGDNEAFCSACGAAVRSDLTFCASCGSAVSEPPIAATASHPPSGGCTCGACGAPAAANDTFCVACGARLGAEPPTKVTAAPQSVIGDSVTTPASATPVAADQPWLRRNRTLAIAVAAIVVLAIAYGVKSRSGNDASVRPSATGVPAASALPHAVVNLVSKENGDRILLSFTSLAADRPYVTDYRAQYRKVGASAWTDFDDGQSRASAIMIKGLKPDTAYAFRVAAVNSLGLGPWSELVAKSPKSRCADDTLIDLYGDEVEAWWRVTSAESAWIDDQISDFVFRRRLKKRLAAYAASYKALTATCAAPTADQATLLKAEAAAYAADVAFARFLLNAAEGDGGTRAEYTRLWNRRKVTTDAASRAWQAFADVNGITLSPPAEIDETKETD